MEFDESSLSELTSEIWTSMLGIDLAPANGHMDSLGHDRTLTGIVQITGDWSGAITVRCPTELASTFASAMFAADPASLELDEVRDALGELTNMTGGSVKGMLPGQCQLGIPAVAEGVDYTLAIPRGHPVCTLGFEYEGRPLEVVIYETSS